MPIGLLLEVNLPVLDYYDRKFIDKYLLFSKSIIF